jgi:hypothetical protein
MPPATLPGRYRPKAARWEGPTAQISFLIQIMRKRLEQAHVPIGLTVARQPAQDWKKPSAYASLHYFLVIGGTLYILRRYNLSIKN